MPISVVSVLLLCNTGGETGGQTLQLTVPAHDCRVHAHTQKHLVRTQNCTHRHAQRLEQFSKSTSNGQLEGREKQQLNPN